MKFLIIHNTASRGNYLPCPIRLPFFFSSCDESVPPSRWLQCPCWGRTEFVQCLCRKACFSGVYYSAVKMCSRQKLGILSLISEVIGGDFEKKKNKTALFFFLQAILERETKRSRIYCWKLWVSPPWAFLFGLFCIIFDLL